MNLRLLTGIRLLACALVVVAGPAYAQRYPSKAISIIVPFAPGSAIDQVSRAMAQGMAAELGTSVVVDNKPGAGGFIAAQAAARALPDGHTLFMTTNTTQSANPHLFNRLPYDPVKDFEPITGLAKGYMMLTVPASSPVKSVAEFIAQGRKKKPSFGAGNSSSRVAGELFKQMTGVDMLFVPYKSNPQAVTDLVGGQLDSMFADPASAIQLVQAGKLRALGYTGPIRTALLPQMPTLHEAGVNGYELSYWAAAYAPRGTPPEVVRQLNTVLVKVANSDAAKKLFVQTALDVFTTTPEGMTQFQREDTEKWGRIIRAAGIQPE